MYCPKWNNIVNYKTDKIFSMFFLIFNFYFLLVCKTLQRICLVKELLHNQTYSEQTSMKPNY